MTPTPVFVGIDIGGTTTQVVLVDERLQMLAHSTTHTPALEGGQAILDAASALIDDLLHTHDVSLAGIGVGSAGVVDTAAGRVAVVSDSFSGWAGFEARDYLEARYGADSLIANDVNAFLAGEMIAGAGAGRGNALGITLGTGVGGALWLDGHLFAGANGAAGEIGHTPGFGDRPCTCGQRGHLETLASGRSISALYEAATGRRLAAADIAALAGPDSAPDTAGDAEAGRIFREAGEGIARAILITTALLDIDAVVIGGGVSHAWHLLYPAIVEALAVEPPVRGRAPVVVRAQLGDSAVAQGAAALAFAARDAR